MGPDHDWWPPRTEVPEADETVLIARRQGLAVGGERQARHPDEPEPFARPLAARRGVPEPDETVLIARRQDPAVRGERQGEEMLGWGRDLSPRDVRGDVPEGDDRAASD